MSTIYYLERELSLNQFLQGLPVAGLEEITESRKVWIGDGANGDRKGRRLTRGFIRAANGDKGGLSWFADNEQLVLLERFGGNKVRAILEALVQAFDTSVRNELGAVMGKDEWFE